MNRILTWLGMLICFGLYASAAQAQDVFDLNTEFVDPVETESDEPARTPEPVEPDQGAPVPIAIDPFSLESFVIPGGSVITPEPVKQGEHWVLIVCGHPGDDDHRTMFAESIETMYDGLVTNCGIDPARIVVQFGSEIVADDGPAIASAKGEATADELSSQLAELSQQLAPEDTLWTIVLGHAYYDGRHSYLNLPGADVHQDDFAAWFAPIRARQVIMITTSVSGYFIRPLSGENRFVITATPDDLEVNETLFHAALAETLSDPPTMEEFDADADGKASLFDLYIALNRNIAQRYLNENLLATEHAMLDDNGDGRGMELQIDYLTVEQGGRERDDAAPPTIRPNSDGFHSIAFDLSMLTLPEPIPEEEPAETEETDDEPTPDEPTPDEPTPDEPTPDEPNS